MQLTSGFGVLEEMGLKNLFFSTLSSRVPKRGNSSRKVRFIHLSISFTGGCKSTKYHKAYLEVSLFTNCLSNQVTAKVTEEIWNFERISTEREMPVLFSALWCKIKSDHKTIVLLIETYFLELTNKRHIKCGLSSFRSDQRVKTRWFDISIGVQ